MKDDAVGDPLDLVTAMYDAILPTSLPVLPTLDVDAVFRVSINATEPGGLWFDVVVLPDDRVALVIGEVPGVGLTCAITAAQMRAVIRAGLRRDGDVVAAIHLADLHAEDVADARGTTALVVLVDADRGLVTYATAGHPPPLLLSSDGSMVVLSDTGGGPLGTGSGTGYACATCGLSEGDSVLLAGLSTALSVLQSEPDHFRNGSTLSAKNLRLLADTLGGDLADPGAMCLLTAAHRAQSQRQLVIRLDKEPDPVRSARQALDDWIAELDASSMDQMGLTHAAAELVTNALQHGSHGHERRVDLRAHLETNGVAWVEVLDQGNWQVPSDDLERGRGLAMAAGLVDHLGIASRPTGTRAFVQHRMSRPILIEAVSQRGPASATLRSVQVVHTAPRAVSLKGPFAHEDVDRVAAEILVASRGGTVPLSLDLTEVEALSTSAVRLLADLTSVNRSSGMSTAELQITSTRKSVIQRILDLARVPHHVA